MTASALTPASDTLPPQSDGRRRCGRSGDSPRTRRCRHLTVRTGESSSRACPPVSAYRNGLRATTFGPLDRGIGYLVGNADDPQIVKGQYLDAEDADRIGLRARGLRETAGRLTGHAAGIDTTADTIGDRRDTLLADLLDVFGEDTKTWSENVLRRLAARDPERYAGWRPEQLAAALRPYGVRTVQVWATPDDGGPAGNRRGVTRESVEDARRRQEGQS